MKYSGAEVKSGLLIFTTLVLLFGVTFLIGRYTTGETRLWKIQFGYIGGLEEKAPVNYAGHQVGKVEKIEVLQDSQQPVMVTVKILADIKIRKDSRAYVDNLGLLGEKLIEITPGEAHSPELSEDRIIPGVDPVPIYEMMQKMNFLADQMKEMMVVMNPMLKQTNGFIQGEGENIAKIITNAEIISANVRDLTSDLKYRPWRLLRKD